jgi:hypothetical protein
MQPGSGRKPCLSEQERSVMLALVKAPSPGKPAYQLTGDLTGNLDGARAVEFIVMVTLAPARPMR